MAQHSNDKDAFYFPHYCSARHDRKIRRVEKVLGIEGYAIFFKLLEVLREQSDYRYPISDTDLLADEFGTSKEKIDSVIQNFDLFYIDESNNFFSENMIVYLRPFLDRKTAGALSGLKGNLIRYRYITKDELDKKSSEEIIQLSKEHGFSIPSILSPPERHPSATRSLHDSGPARNKQIENTNKQTNKQINRIEPESGGESFYINQKNLDKVLMQCIEAWNTISWLPRYGRLPQNIPGSKTSEILKTIQSYSLDNLLDSIRTYSEIVNPENDQWIIGIPYKDITGFLSTGVDKFVDEQTAKQNHRNPDYVVPVSEIEIDDDLFE